MKSLKYRIKSQSGDAITWEEKSGFLEFLASVPAEAKRFDDALGFDINNVAVHPSDIDGDKDMPLKAGFVIARNNPLLPEPAYCLYSKLNDRALDGYIGIYKNGSITTLKQLEPITDFKTGNSILHGWLRQLVKASCDKIMK